MPTTHHPFALLATLLCVFLSACADGSDAETPHPFASDLRAAGVTELSRVGDGYVDFACESVCAHAAWATSGAGVFSVDRIVEVDEVETNGESAAFVYIVLGVEEAWFPDELGSEVVVRSPRLGTTGFDLEVGDRRAAFLRVEVDNAGFPALAANRWYAPDGDRWRVAGAGCESVSYDTATLRSAARAAYESFPDHGEAPDSSCVDVDFERCPTESLIPPGWMPYPLPCTTD